jgi:valine--pyruvate aminotransferase
VTLELSDFGKSFSGPAGITELMKDLGEALTVSRAMRMLGGGNPAHIPAVQAVWRRRLAELMADGDTVDRVLANYDSPQGGPAFLEALCHCFRQEFGWPITPAHLAITNGSQNTFFFLFNMLAGRQGTRQRRILLPLCPEYIGYADQGLTPDFFTARRPRIEREGDHGFKYRVDFEALEITPDVAAICVSRPTNPSGNVLTDEEMAHLAGLARQHGLPLLVDNAYGRPFPDIIFTEARPVWDEHHVLSFSLSKLGLPGLRTGIVVARPEIIRALSSINAVISLANGNLGPAIVTPLLRSGELLAMSREVIQPYYLKKSQQARRWVAEAFGSNVPYRVHRSEGALFLWLWFEGLPISAAELYQRLKARNVLVIPGHYFFFGLSEPWAHGHECIRLTFSQADAVVQEGISILAEEVRRAYGL